MRDLSFTNSSQTGYVISGFGSGGWDGDVIVRLFSSAAETGNIPVNKSTTRR
jgi:hypothetical protein